jgi:hypothetical protein
MSPAAVANVCIASTGNAYSIICYKALIHKTLIHKTLIYKALIELEKSILTPKLPI